MKALEEQTYYEILEVNPKATSKEIQTAYERARETFENDSVAIYSLFSEQEIKRVQSAIEEAYQILSDEPSRKDYDRSHLQPGPWTTGSDLPRSHEESKEHVKSSSPPPSPHPSPERIVPQGETTYRGGTLKQIREKMGVDLKDISRETKINPRILQEIEEEAFEKLPPVVYLKGFLRAYAQSLGLDPRQVTEGYLQFLKAGQTK
jgi:flagellar biosynthesis protein FlhG